MARSVIITIPEPCHEKWSEMTPADRGRFCAACQKTVRDFTFATDSEIASAVNADAGLCGRFTSSQLHRTLYLKRPARKPYTIAAGIVALLGFGGYEAKAQEPVKAEIGQNPAQKSFSETNITVSGVVTDNNDFPLPGLDVVNRTTQDTVTTDFDGKYSIVAKVGDEIQFTYPGMVSQNIIVENEKNIDIRLEDDIDRDRYVNVIVGMMGPQRTFFGRIFHRIGNWFR